MNVSTVSTKFQVVIPKALRAKLHIKPGQKVYLESKKPGEITIKTTSLVDKLYGSMPGVWGPDSDAYLKQLRDEADRDRT